MINNKQIKIIELKLENNTKAIFNKWTWFVL